MLDFFDARLFCAVSVLALASSTPTLVAADDSSAEASGRRACEEGERLAGGYPILSRILELGGGDERILELGAGDERILELGAGDDGCEEPQAVAPRWGVDEWVGLFVEQ